MGNYISNNYLYLLARRQLGRYNIESRVYKELERQKTKPVVAPKFDDEQINYHKLMTADKDYLKKVSRKDAQLDNRLKDVYVTSEDKKIEGSSGVEQDTERPLPLERHTELFDLGFKESNVIPPGRVSLTQTMQFLAGHRVKPEEWPVSRITKEYKIKDDVANDILTYYRSFEFYTPELKDKIDLKNLIGDNQKQKQIETKADNSSANK